MADHKFKEVIRIDRKVYRIIYNSISIILMVLILYRGFNPKVQFDLSLSGNIVGAVFLLLGLRILMKAFERYDTTGFLGFSEERENGLITTGSQAIVRHPLYTGTILIFLAFPLLINYYTSIIGTVMVILYLPIGIYLEEKKLIKMYPEYLEYRKVTPSVFPGILGFWKLIN